MNAADRLARLRHTLQTAGRVVAGAITVVDAAERVVAEFTTASGASS